MTEDHRNDAAGEHRPPGDPTPQRIHAIRLGHGDPGPPDSESWDGKRGLRANYSSHSLADKQAPHPTALVTQYRRSGYAENRGQQARARGNADCLSLIRDNRKRPAPASAVALRKAEVFPASAESITGRGAPYNRRIVPSAHSPRNARWDQITGTPGRTQPRPDAFLGNR